MQQARRACCGYLSGMCFEDFRSMDAWLWWKTWQWAKRRHPN